MWWAPVRRHGPGALPASPLKLAVFTHGAVCQQLSVQLFATTWACWDIVDGSKTYLYFANVGRLLCCS